MKVKEKKVELIELFYDLIYVYAISKMTLLIEEPIDGSVDPTRFFYYIVFSIIIIQSWLQMTNYVNRYGTWRWYEYIMTATNMLAVVYLSVTITGEWTQYTAFTFNLSMIVMTLSVAILYAVQVHIDKQDPDAARSSFWIMGIVTAMYAFSLSITFSDYYDLALFTDILAVILGGILPFIFRKSYDPAIISFPHLTERLELLTIITFGESIVGMTGFFDTESASLVPVIIFAFVLLMFGNYVVQVHYIMNHHQIDDGKVLIYCHYFIILSVNIMTVALLYFESTEADHLLTALMLIFSQILFYMALEATSYYSLPEFRFEWTDLVKSMVMVGIGSVIILVFLSSPYGFLIGALMTSTGNFLIKSYKYSSNRCVNVIHT